MRIPLDLTGLTRPELLLLVDLLVRGAEDMALVYRTPDLALPLGRAVVGELTLRREGPAGAHVTEAVLPDLPLEDFANLVRAARPRLWAWGQGWREIGRDPLADFFDRTLAALDAHLAARLALARKLAALAN